MANTANITLVTTANTFDQWRIQTNLLIDDVEEIARENFVKERGSVTVNQGTLTLANSSVTTLLDVKSGARIDGTLSVRTIDQDAAGDVTLASGDIVFSNRASGGLFGVNVNTKFDAANVEFSNGNVFFSNASATGLVVIRPNTNFLTDVSVSKNVSVSQNTSTGNLAVTQNTTTGNLSTANVVVSALANIVTGNIITANISTLNVEATGAKANIRLANIANIVGVNVVVSELTTTTANVGTVNSTVFITSAGLNVTDQANNAYAAANARVLKAGDTMTGNLNVAASIISQNIVPNINVTYNIGEPTKRFKDLYLSNSTIYLGDATITANGIRINVEALNVNTNAVMSVANIGTANIATIVTGTITATTLNLTDPISGPAETNESSYRLRVSSTSRGDGAFGVRLGSAANGNAWINFDTATGNVWRVTANSTEGTYYTLLTVQNVVDSVVSTSTTGAAAPNSVKTSYDQASTARDQANTARDQANTARTQANTARDAANGAYGQANGAYGQANGAYAQANVVYAQANTAYDQANTARDQANTARTQANTARDQANSAYGQANTATTNAAAADTIAKNAYGQANTATTNAGNAYGQANTATTNAGNAYLQANNARSDANATFATINTTFATLNTSAGAQNTAIAASNSAHGAANSAIAASNSAHATVNSTFGTVNTNISNAYTTANNAFNQANNALPTLNIISATSVTAIKNQHYVLKNASATTVTLPASPAAGDAIWISTENNLTTNIIARNGNKIKSLSEDLTLDVANVAVQLRYVDSTVGWTFN